MYPCVCLCCVCLWTVTDRVARHTLCRRLAVAKAKQPSLVMKEVDENRKKKKRTSTTAPAAAAAAEPSSAGVPVVDLICAACNTTLPTTAFSPRQQRIGGGKQRCRECIAAVEAELQGKKPTTTTATQEEVAAPSAQGQAPSSNSDGRVSNGSADVDGLRKVVLELIAQAARPPVHVAALSLAYKQRTGHSIKVDYRGGMLAFMRAELAAETVLLGEGNDSFVRMATPIARTVQWLRNCVATNGPILVSMVGRMYHEA
jgi:hypothetical protein